MFRIIGELQAEINERFMLLPVDADGVPIHMGDTVEGELPDNTTVKGTVTTYHIHNGDDPDTVYVKVDCGGGWTIKELKVKHCRHVKPDPVKELLRRMADEVYDDSHETPFDRDFIVEKYVDELRDLLYGDEECVKEDGFNE